MRIPLYRIYRDKDDLKALTRVWERGSDWANGKEIDQLERYVARYIGRRYAVAFNSGGSALHAMLIAHGLKNTLDVFPNEIIVPSFTFIATVNAVMAINAWPECADIEKTSYGLSAESVRSRISEDTKAIMPIHYGGMPAVEIEEIREIARENNLLLFEDSAESIGAKLKNRKVGTFGDSAVFSFNASKVVSAGEGGIVVTDSKEVCEKLRLFRSYGKRNGQFVAFGMNYRMDSFTASLALSQMKKIEKLISMRQKVAEAYNGYLNEHIRTDDSLMRNVCQMYTIRKAGRNALRRRLERAGIASEVYFNPIHHTNYFKKHHSRVYLPVTESLSRRVLSLPIYPHMPDKEIRAVAKVVNE